MTQLAGQSVDTRVYDSKNQPVSLLHVNIKIYSSKRLLALFTLIVGTTFGLAAAWEFLVEPQLLAGHSEYEPESAEERWEYVITATAFTILALLVPLWLVLNLERRRQATMLDLRQAAAVYESTLDGVLITSRDGEIHDVNKAFSILTGYARDEVAGRDISSILSIQQDEDVSGNIWQSIRQNGHWSGEITDRKKSGESYSALVGISCVRDEQNRVTNYVVILSDITAMLTHQKQLEYLANHDHLTSLPNRTLFNDRFEHALQNARRRGNRVIMMFLDLDNFKIVNDSLGHPTGDILLQRVAERIRACVRESDTVARVGGDEFSVILENLDDIEFAEKIAQDVIDAVTEPVIIQNRQMQVTTSIGVSIYPDNGTDADKLVKCADQALYHAKKAGRNTYQFFNPEIQSFASQRYRLVSALQHALKRNEFMLYYQPVYCMQNGKACGAEALLRWQMCDTELVMPGKFIPLLEQTGMILPVSEWVIHNACRQWAALQESSTRALSLSLNISGYQFQHQDLVKVIDEALAITGLDPALLELEVTESTLLHDLPKAVKILQNLKELGIRVALDDFGTGFSSLSQLRNLPIDTLKLDCSFISDLINEPDDTMLVSTIMHLCRVMDLAVVAEGVETVAQYALLHELGCRLAQGYLISRPLALDALMSYLKQQGILPAGPVRAANLSGTPATGDCTRTPVPVCT